MAHDHLHDRAPAPAYNMAGSQLPFLPDYQLMKPAPAAARRQSRSPSAQRSLSATLLKQPSLHELRADYVLAGGSGPLLPPPVLGGGPHSRSSSIDWTSGPGTSASVSPNSSRPATPALHVPGSLSRPDSPASQADKRESRRSWWSGGAGKLTKKDRQEQRRPLAWIAGHPDHEEYDVAGLVNGRPVPEIWDTTTGNCVIHIFSRASGRGASFRVDAAVFESSDVLNRLAFDDVHGIRRQMPLDVRIQSMRLDDRTHSSVAALFLPIKLNNESHIPTTFRDMSAADKNDFKDPGLEDLQTLIDIRNFFAFLCGQSLVATEKRSSFFHIFMNISGILKTYQFSNADGSTYGPVANASFDTYVDELGLDDVRGSRAKTIEALVLGERMKSVLLYNEAFTHAAGKHDDIVGMKSSVFGTVSPITQNRLYRAALDLEKRTASIRLTLESFDFPALFTGIMASKKSEERREGVRFEQWKDAFLGMRKFVLSMLKQRYGDWPPKAKSKKNDLETSGLNRLVVRDLYQDMCAVYDLLVDRTNLTTRTVNGTDLAADREEATVRALRVVLSEYDRSSPPVKPPMPFDLPRIPNLRITRPEFGMGDKKLEIKALQKKVKDDEIEQILSHCSNADAPPTPFLDAFRDMERRAAHGRTISEIADQRVGQWIFAYVVLQALPLLATDAPALKWTRGVEYFLCAPPRSGVPWANPDAGGGGAGTDRTWFAVENNGRGVVSLPSDVLVHSVDAIYRRSHCWAVAERWTAADPRLNRALHQQEAMAAHDLADRSDSFSGPVFAPTSSFSATALANPSAPAYLPLPPSNSNLNLLSAAAAAAPRSASPRTSHRHSSLGLGLEALPLPPPGVAPDGSFRPRSVSPAGLPRSSSAHQVDKGKTFEAILANMGSEERGRRGGRKK